MTNALLAESNPLVATLMVVVFVAAIFLFIWGNKALCRKAAGWSDLIRQFPAPEIERPGDTFEGMSGWIGSTEFKQSFTLQLIQEGLLVRPDFATRAPILIPWPKIIEAHVSEARVFGHEQNILLKVEWEKLLDFSVPRKALPLVEAYVSADRLRKTEINSGNITSISELFMERWRNRNNR
jgi:hypothetical protein